MIFSNPKQTSKAGFTLMELMVYMGIVGIVVIIAGEAFSNSTRTRVRTDNMIRANQDAENVAMLFKEDVEQLGTKSGKGDGNTFFAASKRIYIDPDNTDDNKKDSSSFRILKSGEFSDLAFKRTRYDENGRYQAIDSVHWYVEDGVLKRSCTILEPTSGFALPDGDPCVSNGTDSNPVQMATGISTFEVEAAFPGTTEDQTQIFPASGSNQFILFPRLDASGEYNRSFVSFTSENTAGEALGYGNEITLSGFWSNYQNKEDNIENAILPDGEQRVNQAIALNTTDNLGNDWNTLCLEYGKMTFSPDTVYEIAFEVTSQSSGDRSSTFVPAEDHMAVGFRKSTGDYAKSKKESHHVILSDFLFYPPLDNNSGAGAGKRSMRFTVPEKVENVCLAFTFAFYSPLVYLGRISIKDLKVLQVATANYKFNGFNPEAGNNPKEKKNVRALRLKLQVSRGAKNGGKGETGDVNLVIPIPSNGTGD